MEAIRYRPEIDGLRAIAVTAVICFHAQFAVFNTKIARGGYLGVDVFFVISGYLITRLILQDVEQDRFSLVAFYARRARRIFPALFAVLASTGIAAIFLLAPAPLVDFSESLAACVFFVSNIFFWFRTDYFSEPGELTPLLHMWSLSVEEQFYLLFPAALIAISRFALYRVISSLIVLAAASLGIGLIAQQTHFSAAFYLFPFRAWELLTGALVAAGEGRRRSALPPTYGPVASIAGLLLLLSCFTCADSAKPIGVFSVLAVVGTSLILATDRLPAHNFLASPLFVGLGLISYSLYLIHQPLFAFMRMVTLNAPSQTSYVLLSLMSIALAFVSWKYIEQPFRTSRGSDRRFWLYAMAASLVLCAGAAILVLSGGWPERYSAEQQALLKLDPRRGSLEVDGRPCTRRSVADACIIGQRRLPPTFAILGDSHAETLAEPLDRLLKEVNASAFLYTNAGCPFILNVTLMDNASPCNVYAEAAIASLRRHRISSVIINDRSTAYIVGTRFDNGEGGVEPGAAFPVEPVGFNGTESERIEATLDEWRRTIRRLLDQHVTVYYILPVPEVGWHVPRTLAKLIAQHGPPLTTSLPRYLQRNRLLFDLAKEFSSDNRFVPFFPHNVFCKDFTNRCYTHDDTEVFYTDTDHLSRQGAERLVRALARNINGR